MSDNKMQHPLPSPYANRKPARRSPVNAPAPSGEQPRTFLGKVVVTLFQVFGEEFEVDTGDQPMTQEELVAAVRSGSGKSLGDRTPGRVLDDEHSVLPWGETDYADIYADMGDELSFNEEFDPDAPLW